MDYPPLHRLDSAGLKPPHPKQREIYQACFTPHRDKWYIDACCGFGVGKTQTCLDVAQMALSRGPRERVLFLEPDKDRMNTLFVAQWEDQVPGYLYTHISGTREIIWHNGARLKYGHRDIRGNKKMAADAKSGPGYSAILIDEAAMNFNPAMMINLSARLRIESPGLFMLTSSTPEVGPYGDWINREGHIRITARTVENPYLWPSPEEYDADLRRNMSPQQAARLLDGELVALEGRVWNDARVKENGKWVMWPKGNVHPHRFDRTRGYTLAADIGNHSAWLVIQDVPILDAYGTPIRNHRPVHVACAEYTPDDGDVRKMIGRIQSQYGLPSKIIAGGDIETHNIVTGHTGLEIFRAAGWHAPVVPITGRMGNKMDQLNAAQGLICSHCGERRFCVSEHMMSHDFQTVGRRRGLREVWEQDTWPDDVNRMGAYLQKEGALEHMRDAFLYYAIDVNPLHRGNEYHGDSVREITRSPNMFSPSY